MIEPEQSPLGYRVGDLVIQLSTFSVLDGDREIAMPKLSFDLFTALARRAPDVVSVDTLMGDVWGQVVVSDETVSQRVKLVRDALGKARRNYIETVRGRGFRLTVPVKAEFPSENVEPESQSPADPAGAPGTDAPDSTPQQPATRPERRQLTVLSCNLVGAAALAEHIELEALRKLLRTYQSRCADVVRQFDGHIGRYVGDGLLVYFGYPRAHEEDPERAVRAGLGIVDAVGTMNAELDADIELAVRIGIATGLVLVGDLVGDGASEQQAVVGPTPNLAACLHALAPPNGVVIGNRTRELLGQRFACEDLGAHEMEGMSKPVRAWRVEREAEGRSRFKLTHPGELTPLVGRQDEIELLSRRWTQAQAGEGQVVLLSGEPGIGKSRICHAFRQELADQPHTHVRYQCSPYHGNSALYPFISQLERAAGFGRDDSDEQKLDKLEHHLAAAAEKEASAAPLLAALLSLPGDRRYPPLNMSAEKQKLETLRVLLAHLEGLAAAQPVLLVFEDLHWIDPTSQELLDMIVDWVTDRCVLALVTFRPEYIATWAGEAQVTALTINRLSARQTEAMVEALGAQSVLPDDVRRQIVTRTDGIPLFVEELTQTVLDSERAGPMPGRTIPSTLHDSLTARLDQLGAASEIARLAAVIGREFSYKLLAAVADTGKDQLTSALERVVQSGLVGQRGLPPDANYQFKHALVRDAAYQSLLTDRLRRHHERIAKAIEQHFPERIEVEPELLAHHYTEAGLIEPAVRYWRRAGERAAARSAHVEAIGHLGKGLAVIRKAQGEAERDRAELALRIALGPVLHAVKGYAAIEAKENFEKALQLWEGVGEPIQLCPIQYGLWLFHATRAELSRAYGYAGELLEAATSVQEPAYILDAHLALSCTTYFLGDFSQAHGHGERGSSCSGAVRYPRHALQNPGVICTTVDALSLWCLGYPDQAQSRAEEALERARRLSHPFTLAVVLTWISMLHQYRHEAVEAEALASEAAELSREQSFPFWLPVATMIQGFAMIEQGRHDDGAPMLRNGLDAYRATGSWSFMTYGLLIAADMHGRAGEAEKAQQVIGEALAVADQTGERYMEAEIHRLQGNLLNAPPSSDFAAAERSFRNAIEVARQQSAKSLELRAAMSLARLWRDQGRSKDAVALLAPFNEWFTEGFETHDLKEARELLDEIQPG